jgi:Zn-finger nucleic acid-binding protein
MRTYERNGIHLEQCTGCRGVFLDFGELEHLTQLESRFVAQPPPAQGYGPSWGNQGHHGNQRYRRNGFSGLFFSS